jgi:hypothetical protein
MSQPSYPAPFAWTLDEIVTAELMNDVSSAIQFLSQPPLFYGQQTSATGASIPSGAFTTVTFNNEVADPYNMHSDSSDTGQIVIPAGCDGVYLLTGQVPYVDSSSGGTVQAAYSYNGAQGTGECQGPSSAGSHPSCAVADLIVASAGDVLRLQAYQNTGGALNLRTGEDTSGSVLFPQVVTRWVGLKPSLDPAVVDALPAQVTWINGDKAASSAGDYAWNTLITGAVEFLAYPPMTRAIAADAQSIANATLSTIAGLAASFDNRSAWDADTSTWTCPCPGTYLMGVSTMTAAEDANYSGVCGITVTGAGTVAGTFYGGAQKGPQVGAQYLRTHRFDTGDTAVPFVWQNFGSTIDTVVANNNVRFFALWTGS